MDESDEIADWWPFTNRAHFELADYAFRQTRTSAKKIDSLMDIWALWNKESGFGIDELSPPYDGSNHFYS